MELNIGFNALETMVRAVKQWATSAGADFYERSMQTCSLVAKVHSHWW
jgi:hypothetical protein